MSGTLTVIDPGIAVSIQDRGRFGLRRFGVPTAGALDPLLLAAVNHLLANPPGAAGLEILIAGPTLIAGQLPVALAMGGEIGGEILQEGGSLRPMPTWRGFVLNPGERLKIGAIRRGTAYLAVSGGIQTEFSLGSRSTYRRAGLGPALLAGGVLPCGRAQDCFAAAPWQPPTGPIRLLPGPQADHFTDAAAEILVSQPYRIAAKSDRMGLRLTGPILDHTTLGAECPTEAVLPGLIQVPADGQPIVLLADAQTTGGYAKIAAVISADLPRLGHARPGDRLSFRWVSRPDAIAALAETDDHFTLWRQSISRVGGNIDAAALYGSNLISGMTAGDDDD